MLQYIVSSCEGYKLLHQLLLMLQAWRFAGSPGCTTFYLIYNMLSKAGAAKTWGSLQPFVLSVHEEIAGSFSPRDA